MEALNSFFKNNDSDSIWWVNHNEIGEHLFSFDKKKVFNLFQDYPHALTKEEKKIFDEENPEWAKFFEDRN